MTSAAGGEKLEDEIAYMKGHPPRCLGDQFKTAPEILRSFLQEELGEYSTVFSLVCECSNEFVTITSSGEDFSPTCVTCSKCDKTRIVFDPTQHGYDGELGHNTDLKMSQSEEFLCAECGHNSLQIALCFQYSGETDVLDEDDPPDVNPEDLFGWVMIAGHCEKCSAVQEISQEECA